METLSVYTDDLKVLLNQKPWGKTKPSIKDAMEKKIEPYWTNFVLADSSLPLVVQSKETLHIVENSETLARNVIFGRKNTLINII